MVRGALQYTWVKSMNEVGYLSDEDYAAAIAMPLTNETGATPRRSVEKGFVQFTSPAK